MYCATLYLFFIEMMPGRIGRIRWKSIEMMPGQIRPVELGGQIGCKSLRSHCMPAQSNSTGQIGCKSLRLHCMPAQSNWV